jgi:hypothetical protein
LERKRAESYENLKDWFQLLQDTITDLGINSDDIWNFDETGFRIGVGRDQLVITKQQRQLYLEHPTNRESVTAIEAVSAGGAHIPLFLIFSGITHQSSWYSNSELDPNTTIAVSNSGYSNDQLSLDWLLLEYYCWNTRYDFVTHTKHCASTVGFTVFCLLTIS